VRNIWKGLIVGGLTGAGAGIALDVLSRGAQLVGSAGRKAAYIAPEAAERVKSAAVSAGKKATEIAPEAADRVRSAVNAGATHLNEAEISDHRTTGTVEKVMATGQADQAREALGQATRKAIRLVHSVRETVSNGSIG
jgi:hypothetical protein